MTEIRIPVPRVPAGLIGNLVGLFGLIAVAVAVGGLTGNWWWAVLTGGLSAVVLSYVAGAHTEVTASVVPATPETRPRPVAVARPA